MTSVPGGTGSGDGYGYHPPPEPGHNPYQPWSPYGGDPRAEPPRLDGISIAAFVCALTCCAAPVGIGLGIAGIVRTKERRRTGRWAAVSGLIIGIVGTIALVAGGIGLVWYSTNVVFFDEAQPGDCVDIGDSDIWKAECGEEHDAEVLYSGTFDDASLSDFNDLDPAEFCRKLPLDRRYEALFGDPAFAVDVYFESFGDDPDDGDLYLCVAQKSSGASLSRRLLDTLDATAAGPAQDTSDKVWAGDTTAGDCFDEVEGPKDAEDAEGEQPIEIVDCAVAHDGEVMRFLDVKGDKFPGDGAVEREADTRCLAVFETYVGGGYDASPHDFGYWFPSEESWKLGDRSIICAAYSGEPGGQLTGSVKGSGRADL